ncbi:FkbM family methyltransferase [Pedobacter sp.]
MGLRRIIKNLVNSKKQNLPFLNESYSQEGEDLLLARIFENQTDGFFIDVGALHPQRFSNTFKFYKLGWRGINIDAMPQSMIEFNKIRPEDINLEIPVSDKKEVLSYYIFNEPALNTFSKEMAEERSKKEIYNVQKVVDIETRTLTDILDKYLPEGRAIDFLTIDVEGLDFQVLKSNNWEKYQPKMILLENELEIQEMIGSSIDLFMQAKNYQLYAKTVKTFFYKNKNFSI